MGTLVSNGKGKGIVVNTGSETELGKIATLLKEVGDKKTPLQEAMETLSEQISKFSFGVVAVIFIIGVVTGKNWLEMFTMGVSRSFLFNIIDFTSCCCYSRRFAYCCYSYIGYGCNPNGQKECNFEKVTKCRITGSMQCYLCR